METGEGISDIAVKEKKILGSAIYQNRNFVFYQSILNVAEPVNILNRYLKHPQREPAYRLRRSHADFVTSLHACGYNLSVPSLRERLEESL